MRLGVIDAGAGELRRRLGREPSGVLLTLHYRPELFGRPFSDALDRLPDFPADCVRRDRAVGVRSEWTLVEGGDERSEELAFAG